ncbi:MAG: T9SS type A sorting domain-containing protein [Ignavibacteria bacterium]|nr:T9SS type A sorting domain-containing protein [Ignavibacteria bacterium]
MKKIIFIFVVIFCLFNITQAQTGWFSVTTPINNLELRQIQFTSENTGYAIGDIMLYDSCYLMKTTNGGRNWQSIFIDSLWGSSIFFIDNNTGFIAGQNPSGIIMKTTNGGFNWIKQAEGFATCFYTVFFLDHNTGYAGGRWETVVKTTNGGNNWISKPGTLTGHIRDIYFLNADTGFAVVHANTINKTTNGGDNWIQYYGNGHIFYRITFVNNNTGYLCSERSGYSFVYKTTNTGENWMYSDSIQARFFSIYFLNLNAGYACGDDWVYKTTDAGINWIMQTPSSIYHSWNSIYFLNENTGFIAGNNGVIMKTTNGGNVFVKNISTEIPSAFSLEQNYPNPFNAVTRIKFKVTSEGDRSQKTGVSLGGRSQKTGVRLKVYDLNGREIRTLVNERLEAGVYEVRFDSGDLPSGIYFYRMQTENFISTKKLILLTQVDRLTVKLLINIVNFV